MIAEDFFKTYIPALELALYDSQFSKGTFSTTGPDHYIDKQLNRQVEIFMESNYYKFQDFFDKVAAYFDANSHGVEIYDGLSLAEIRSIVDGYIIQYKKEFPISAS